MIRDSFVFYRSFFEAISLMPPEIQAEVYPALVEYALNGREPKGLSDIAKGVFILVKPNIDASITRFENGKKCAQYGKLGGRPSKKKETPEPEAAPTQTYSLTFEQEVEEMKADRSWNEPVCMKFHINTDELNKRFAAFINHCKSEYVGKSHSDINDAKRHFCSWMRKAYPTTKQHEPEDMPPTSYEFNGGFGGQDI